MLDISYSFLLFILNKSCVDVLKTQTVPRMINGERSIEYMRKRATAVLANVILSLAGIRHPFKNIFYGIIKDRTPTVPPSSCF